MKDDMQEQNDPNASLAAVETARSAEAAAVASHAGHTPGPWTWFEDGELWSVKEREAFDRAFDAARDENGDVEMRDLRFVDNAILALRDDGDGLSEANAHLIVAAPDLLEACKEFVRKCETGQASSRRSYAEMTAAIAKAEGRDQLPSPQAITPAAGG